MAIWMMAGRMAAIDAIADLCSGGFIQIHDAAHTELVELELGAPAFGLVDIYGAAAAEPIAVAEIAETGTADHAHLMEGDGVTEVALLTTSDLELDSLYLVDGETLFIRSFSIAASLLDPVEQQVILKSDDMFTNLSSGYTNFFDFLENRNISYTVGLIGKYAPAYEESLLAKLLALNHVEFWNHGYQHFVDEFTGPDAVTQEGSMQACHDAVFSALGVTMRGFGVPYNQDMDSNTILAFTAMGYEFWLFPPPGAPGLLVERIGGEIEVGTSNPTYSYFVSHYNASAPRVCFQVHPHPYTTTNHFQFVRCIEYLVLRGGRFVTPSQIIDGEV